jgi:hypothetical protein
LEKADVSTVRSPTLTTQSVLHGDVPAATTAEAQMLPKPQRSVQSTPQKVAALLRGLCMGSLDLGQDW